MANKSVVITTVFPQGYNSDRLHTELTSNSKLTGFTHIEKKGANLLIHYTGTINDEAGLDTDLANHEVVNLAEYKQNRYNQIDAKTRDLIAGGFTYDSQQFSLSTPAQANWTTIKGNKLDFSFPLKISTLDNNEYTLNDNGDVESFWTAGKDEIKAHLDSGRTLKKSVFDAVDKAAVDLIIDNR